MLAREDRPLTHEQVCRQWRQCIESDSAASLYLDPEVALLPSMVSDPLIYTSQARKAGEAAGFSSLAVLAERIEEYRILHLGRIRLHGRRVVESQLAGDQSEASLNAFVSALGDLLASGQAEFVIFQDLQDDSPLRRVLLTRRFGRGAVVFQPHRPQPHWWIRFPRPAEDYWRKFSKKSRYNFRWRARKFPHTVACITRKEQIPDFLEKARSLCRQTWQLRRLGLGICGGCDEERFWEFMVSRGAMRCYLLEDHGRPIAFATGFQHNGCFTYDKTGYDPAMSAFSPGQVLLTHILEDLIARDTPQLVDFGFGHGDYKEIFGNFRTMSGPVVLSRRHWRPMLALGFESYSHAVARGVRSLLQKLHLLSLVRHIYRR